MTAPSRSPGKPQPQAELEFDVTQEIDPGLADTLRYGDEPTLANIDFEDLEIALDF